MNTNQQLNQLVFELANSTIRLDYVYAQHSTQEVAPNVVIQPNTAIEQAPITKLVRAVLGDIVLCYPQTKMIYWWVIPTQTNLINVLDANNFSISAYSLTGNVNQSLELIKPVFNPNLAIEPLDSFESWKHTYLPMLIHHHHSKPEHFHNLFTQTYLDALNAQIAATLEQPKFSSTVLCLKLEHKPIGFVYASMVKNLGIINLILIKTDLQGLGFGKHLYWAALNWFREHKIDLFYGTTINQYILRSAPKMGRKVLYVKLQKEL